VRGVPANGAIAATVEADAFELLFVEVAIERHELGGGGRQRIGHYFSIGLIQ
jgi:hypothetical protein